MDKEKIRNIVQNLEGLTYYDWQKVRIAVDECFSKKKKEYERQLTLNSIEEIENAIRSQFG